MSRKRTVFVFVLHAVFLIFIFIVQSMILPHIFARGSIPVILPLTAAGVALFEGGVRGGVFGLMSGILCDISFNQSVMLFTVLLTIVGLLVGLVSETLIAQGFPSFILTSIVILALTAFAQMFSLLFFRGVAFSALLPVALGQTIISLFFAVPIYFMTRALGRTTQRADNR